MRAAVGLGGSLSSFSFSFSSLLLARLLVRLLMVEFLREELAVEFLREETDDLRPPAAELGLSLGNPTMLLVSMLPSLGRNAAWGGCLLGIYVINIEF